MSALNMWATKSGESSLVVPVRTFVTKASYQEWKCRTDPAFRFGLKQTCSAELHGLWPKRFKPAGWSGLRRRTGAGAAGTEPAGMALVSLGRCLFRSGSVVQRTMTATQPYWYVSAAAWIIITKIKERKNTSTKSTKAKRKEKNTGTKVEVSFLFISFLFFPAYWPAVSLQFVHQGALLVRS